MGNRLRLGTSSLVVAAFIGPGTVLTCVTAGLDFGYALGWALVFSVGATFVLQSFTAGSGILANMGVGEAMRAHAFNPAVRVLLAVLVVLGLWAGTAAFETGNLLGAAVGVNMILGDALSHRALVLVIGAAAAGMLMFEVRLITTLLAGLVALMSVVFVITLVLAPVEWGPALRGLVIPSLPEGSLVRTVALVGTTVVAYNLFLHGSAAKRYWEGTPGRFAWRRELVGMAIFLPLGGLISIAILFAGAALPAESIGGVGDLARVIEPAAGSLASVLFGLGLGAAGITSAVTAPLAAACGIREIFGWPDDPKHIGYRLVWVSVLLSGVLFALTGRSPLEVIIAAQAANGILLPFIAGFVLYLSTRQEAVRLPRWFVGLGVLVTLVCAGLGARTLVWVYGQVF